VIVRVQGVLLPSGVPASWQQRFEMTSFTFMCELRAAAVIQTCKRKHVVMLAGQDFVRSSGRSTRMPVAEPVAGMVCLRGRLFEDR